VCAESRLLEALDAAHLFAAGAFIDAGESVVLVSPKGGRGWWDHVTASPEWRDGASDPLDRWSRRVLDRIAAEFGGRAVLPSDGPPYAPFYDWALRTGRSFVSPVRLLVHAESGLWASFRGALVVPFGVTLPPAPDPCKTCAQRPCLTACPVGALTAQGYDLAACHGALEGPAASCMTQGCAARKACPLSIRHARLAEQSAYHMGQFHK
jgi:epoxyqueuosine reductase